MSTAAGEDQFPGSDVHDGEGIARPIPRLHVAAAARHTNPKRLHADGMIDSSTAGDHVSPCARLQVHANDQSTAAVEMRRRGKVDRECRGVRIRDYILEPLAKDRIR